LDASSILTNHQISQESQQESIVSNRCPTSSSLRESSEERQSPESLQTIAHKNSIINNSCNDLNNSINCSQQLRPQLVAFNRNLSQSSAVITTTNSSSLPSLVTDSRQSSEDSGYSEPTSSSNCSSGAKTYAQVMASINDSNQSHSLSPLVVYNSSAPLCPYASHNIDGICPYSEGQCHYLHGDICDLCGRPCLHPNDVEQQKQHREECIKEHEREMELSFAIQRSLDKACGICMDIVIEKDPITERRFGILEKCSHIFCLSCIRKWRQTKQFDNRTIRFANIY
jgi:hypothetical protein